MAQRYPPGIDWQAKYSRWSRWQMGLQSPGRGIASGTGLDRRNRCLFMNWFTFALMTVVSWGLYGIFLHSGQVAMKDQSNGLFKAFLFVGLAYFLTAVLAPLAMLATRKADWNFPVAGAGLVARGGDRRGHRRVLRAAGLWE